MVLNKIACSILVIIWCCVGNNMSVAKDVHNNMAPKNLREGSSFQPLERKITQYLPNTPSAPELNDFKELFKKDKDITNVPVIDKDVVTKAENNIDMENRVVIEKGDFKNGIRKRDAYRESLLYQLTSSPVVLGIFTVVFSSIVLVYVGIRKCGGSL